MTLIPLADATNLTSVRLVATDLDGTLTIADKLTPKLLNAFETLKQADISVLIVTGRSAGWVNAIAAYFPVTGAIAENGGLFYKGDSQSFITPISDLKHHRLKLLETFELLKAQFPKIQETSDNQFRLTDWTFDIEGISPSELDTMTELCQTQGWSFTYSTVQCHIKPMGQNKADGLLQVLHRQFPEVSLEQIITVGDSPNDETLFNSQYFPRSVGVANLLKYSDRLTHKPTYITNLSEGNGFCELVQHLTQSP
ncbi:HAD family hydrolase [Myxacorys almedinensis]|uniref:HAD-IIB family hydrolase n=1 Tax=Myxacorys almedinensis A TaxID=2690445 RepID=A0A8J8CL84_9CYAN|nr:HAD family hydrolase [Myxacorys almedinensis]NDJ15842.1 HAD-IIB family hydrolase [Myxacorys almedinensis A]